MHSKVKMSQCTSLSVSTQSSKHEGSAVSLPKSEPHLLTELGMKYFHGWVYYTPSSKDTITSALDRLSTSDTFQCSVSRLQPRTWLVVAEVSDAESPEVAMEPVHDEDYLFSVVALHVEVRAKEDGTGSYLLVERRNRENYHVQHVLGVFLATLRELHLQEVLTDDDQDWRSWSQGSQGSQGSLGSLRSLLGDTDDDEEEEDKKEGDDVSECSSDVLSKGGCTSDFCWSWCDDPIRGVSPASDVDVEREGDADDESEPESVKDLCHWSFATPTLSYPNTSRLKRLFGDSFIIA